MPRFSPFLLLPVAACLALPVRAQAPAPAPAASIIAPDVRFEAPRLRAALELPRSEANFGFSVKRSPIFGDVWAWDFEVTDHAVVVKRLSKGLRNSSVDAESWLQIGASRDALGDKAGANAAYARASSGFQAQAAQKPRDPLPLLRRGAALESLGKGKLAGPLYRSALKMAPRDERALLALSSWLRHNSAGLMQDAMQASIGQALSAVASTEAPQLAALARALTSLQQKLRPAELKSMRADLAESQALQERAIAVAPHSPRVYEARAAGAFMAAATQSMLDIGRQITQAAALGPDERSEAFERVGQSMGASLLNLANASTQADLERAARLSPPPQAARLFAMAAFAQLIRLQTARDESEKPALSAGLQRTTAAMEALARGPEGKDSAVVWAFLSLARTLPQISGTQDEAALERSVRDAETAARHALQLDERSPAAWNTLLIAVSQSEARKAELATLALRRASLFNTLDSRMVAARSLSLVGDDARALQQIEAALKVDGSSAPARLARAVLLLRRADDASLAQADQLLAGLDAKGAKALDVQLGYERSGALVVLRARQHRLSEAAQALSSLSKARPNDDSDRLRQAFLSDVSVFGQAIQDAKRGDDEALIQRALEQAGLSVSFGTSDAPMNTGTSGG